MSSSEAESASGSEASRSPRRSEGDGGAGKGFLEEHPGHKSSMRAMSIVALLCAVGFGVFTLADSTVGQTGVYVTLGFLLAAFAPKALQKFAEEAVLA